MMYVNKSNGKKAVIIDHDDVRATYMLEFEDGKSTTIASTTFKRWYKAIEEEVIEKPTIIEEQVVEELEMVDGDEALEQAVVEPIEEVVNDDICADGRTYAEIGKEIAEQAKQKAKDAKKKASKKVDKIEKAPYSEDTVAANIIRAASLCVTPKSKHDLVLKNDDKQTLAVVYVGKKSLTFYFNGEDIKEKLIASGAEIIESSEKFDYYSKIDINTLISVLPMLTV